MSARTSEDAKGALPLDAKFIRHLRRQLLAKVYSYDWTGATQILSVLAPLALTGSRAAQDKEIAKRLRTALRKAAEFGEVAMIMLLLRHGASAKAGKCEALVAAARSASTRAVKALLDAGADVHAQDDAVFCQAIYANDEEMYKLLVERGADVNARCGYPLVISCGFDRVGVVGYLLAKGAKIEPVISACLYEAVKRDAAQATSMLLARGAGLGPHDGWLWEGLTAHQLAVSRKSANVIPILDAAFVMQKLLNAKPNTSNPVGGSEKAERPLATRL